MKKDNKLRARLNADEISRLMGSFDERFYIEAETALAEGLPQAAPARRKSSLAYLTESVKSLGIAAAVVAVVGLGVYLGTLGFSRGWFGTPSVDPGSEGGVTGAGLDTTAGTDGDETAAKDETDTQDETETLAEPVWSEGLIFRNCPGGVAVSGLGTCTDVDLIIPPTHYGTPVVAVAENAFEDKTEIRSVILPESVTSIGAFAFNGCTSLQSIRLPENNVTYIDHEAFARCSSLTEVYLYDGTVCSWGLFHGDTSLATLRLPATMLEIPGRLCEECTSLTRVIMPPSCERIGNDAFLRCSSLRDVTLSETLRSLGTSAFAGTALDLAALKLPRSLTFVGGGAFDPLDLPGMTIPPEGGVYLEDGTPLGTYELYVDDVLIYVYTSEKTYTVREGTRMLAEWSINMFPSTYNEEWRYMTLVLPESLEILCGEVISDGISPDLNHPNYRLEGKRDGFTSTSYLDQ